jgi:hypothetical protein
VTVPATRGLVKFRSGKPDEGRTLYQIAMEEANTLGFKRDKAMAAIFLAREEILAGSRYAREAVDRAMVESDAGPSDAIALLRKRLATLYASKLDSEERSYS